MRTVLVLEDEPIILNLIRHLLSENYIVLVSSTAAEAIQRFHENDGQISVLIADVTLPVSSGIHVALELRYRNPWLKIILISGYPETCGPIKGTPS